MCPAYALREEYAGTVEQELGGEKREVPVFAGGIINTPSGDLDVRKALDDGDGVIVTDDEQLANVLDVHPALKRVKQPARPTADAGYDHFNLDELRREAKRRGIDGLGGKAKADVIAALEDHDAAQKGA